MFFLIFATKVTMESQIVSKKTIRLKAPNPLFERWLNQWHLEEVSEGNEVTIYSRALTSLKKYPLVLKSGLECIILEHFDEQLCLKLNEKLNEHKEQNGVPRDLSDLEKFIKNQTLETKKRTEPIKSTKRRQNCVTSMTQSSQASPLRKKTKPYIPAKKSAAYGLLTALLLKEKENGYSGFITKSELITKAQAHSDVSFKKPAPGTYYSGWSSMSQLVAKGLVNRSGNPAKFSLTEEGRALALQLKDVDEGLQVNVDEPEVNDSEPVLSLISSDELVIPLKPRGKKKKEVNEVKKSNGASSQSHDFETEEMIFLPLMFEIILLVDTAETVGLAKRDQDEAIIALKNTGIKFEVRHLKVGDYIWVARDRIGREMVLPYIVERKRLDDLGSSIKDGRFHEQKFRLKQCGLPNKIYLVEDSGLERNGLPIENIQKGITNTMACDKFSVRMTKNLLESMRYLSTLTNILTQMFQKKTLFSCKKEDLPETLNLEDDIISLLSFPDFSYNMGKVKALTPREIFAKQLVQLHGLSADKAWAITEHYQTPKELIEGFLHGNAETIVSQLTCGILERKVGSQLAATLKYFYTTLEFSG